MEKSRIIRAWRDPEYYESLSEAERAEIPANPAGLIDVDDDVLDSVTGGCGCKPPDPYTCQGYTALCTPCPPMHCY